MIVMDHTRIASFLTFSKEADKLMSLTTNDLVHRIEERIRYNLVI